MQESQQSTEDGQTHEVTAREPAWITARHRPCISKNSEGKPVVQPQYIEESMSVGDLIEMLVSDAEYHCTCGDDFANWQAVEAHFEQVGREAANAVRATPSQPSDSAETVEVDRQVLRTFLDWTYWDSAISTAPEEVREAEDTLWEALDSSRDDGGS